MVHRMTVGLASTMVLRALASAAAGRDIDALVAELDLNRRQITNATVKLLQKGLILRQRDGVLRLTEDGVAAAAEGTVIRGSRQKVSRSQRNTFRERAWRSMRVRRRFTISEVVSDAAGPDDRQPDDNARRYVSRLRQAGFVMELPRRAPGTALSSNGFKRFALVRNSGPRAPVWCGEKGTVHDFNTGEDHPCTPS